jgi:sRNA-binding regulator protein Hfq
MANRKLIRPDMQELKRDLSGRGVRRKQTPPEQTNAEEFYYLKQMAAKTPMVVVLTDGEELRGWIEWYDKGSIKLNRQGDPNLVLLKHSIRYMFKEEELRRGRRPRTQREARRPDLEDASAANGPEESTNGDEA